MVAESPCATHGMAPWHAHVAGYATWQAREGQGVRGGGRSSPFFNSPAPFRAWGTGTLPTTPREPGLPGADTNGHDSNRPPRRADHCDGTYVEREKGFLWQLRRLSLLAATTVLPPKPPPPPLQSPSPRSPPSSPSPAEHHTFLHPRGLNQPRDPHAGDQDVSLPTQLLQGGLLGPGVRHGDHRILHRRNGGGSVGVRDGAWGTGQASGMTFWTANRRDADRVPLLATTPGPLPSMEVFPVQSSGRTRTAWLVVGGWWLTAGRGG